MYKVRFQICSDEQPPFGFYQTRKTGQRQCINQRWKLLVLYSMKWKRKRKWAANLVKQLCLDRGSPGLFGWFSTSFASLVIPVSMRICLKKPRMGCFGCAYFCFHSISRGAARWNWPGRWWQYTDGQLGDTDQMAFLPAQWLFFGVILKNTHCSLQWRSLIWPCIFHVYYKHFAELLRI